MNPLGLIPVSGAAEITSSFDRRKWRLDRRSATKSFALGTGGDCIPWRSGFVDTGRRGLGFDAASAKIAFSHSCGGSRK